MFTTILRTGFLAFLLNNYLKTKYPEKYHNVLISISYNFFYFLSKVQIIFMKISKKIEENPSLLKIKKDFMLLLNFNPRTIEITEYIKNGEYIKSDDLGDNNYDFLLHSWSNDENGCINKKIMYDKNEIVTSSELSEIKFMLVEINIGENNYKIDLKTDRYNFYVVGNVFTKQFFIFYLKQFLKLNDLIYDNNNKLSIKTLDQNVNIIEFDFTDKNESILLEKNGYKLSNCK
jgi:hypothetical protein